MTDHQQTSDQRLAAMTGAPEDQARTLRNAIRCGGESADRVRLLALCGDPVARLVVPQTLVDRLPGIPRSLTTSWVVLGNYPTDHWITAARSLMRPLPDREVEVACDDCCFGGLLGDRSIGCSNCGRTGTVTLTVNAEHWLTTVGALAVGRGILGECGCSALFNCSNCLSIGTRRQAYGIRRALDAAERWIKAPTAANLETWHRSLLTSPGIPVWVPRPWWRLGTNAEPRGPEAQSQSAASILGDRPVIELLRAAWLEVV